MKVIGSNVTNWSTVRNRIVTLASNASKASKDTSSPWIPYRSVCIPFRSLFIESDCSCFDGSDRREHMEFQIKVTKA